MLRHLVKSLAWTCGLGYIAMWLIVFLSLDGAPIVRSSPSCTALDGVVMVFWTCELHTPLWFLANLVNIAMSYTVWAPVFLAVASVDPAVIFIASTIVGTHVLGLPACLYVMLRIFAWLARCLVPGPTVALR